MNGHTFETLVHQATGGISRRASLMRLGTAGLATAFALPFAADAKKKAGKKGKDNKDKKKTCPQCPPPVDLCVPQAEKCTEFMTASCGGDSECLTRLPCCSFLGSCDTSGFLACLANA